MPNNYHLSVKRFMTREGITSSALAKRMGTSRSVVLLTLDKHIIPPDSHWPDLLDALGLELVLRFKEAEADEPVESQPSCSNFPPTQEGA